MKPLTFQGTDSGDAFEFSIDFYERLYDIGIVKKHGFEFVTFLLDKDTKQWYRAYFECRSPIFPTLIL